MRLCRAIALGLILCCGLAGVAEAKCYQGAASGDAQTCETRPLGGNNTDGSANAQSLSGLNLLGTIAATAGRLGYIIQTQDTAGNCGGSGGNANGLVVSFDDGAGGTATNLIVAYASAKGGQGGAITWSGMPHTGRIRYYGTAGCQVGAAQW